MDLAGILAVVNEQGGGHINKSFQPLMDSTSGAAGTSDVPVQKVSRKKKTGPSKARTSATTVVADVGEKEVSAEGTVGATQETVGENLVDDEAGDGEGLKVTKGRRLRKVASTEVAAAMDSEETKSDEGVRKLASDSDVNKEGQSIKRHKK
ncbi:hypothetical protein Dimus_030079 [Dionaea muscipula]